MVRAISGIIKSYCILFSFFLHDTHTAQNMVCSFLDRDVYIKHSFSALLNNIFHNIQMSLRFSFTIKMKKANKIIGQGRVCSAVFMTYFKIHQILKWICFSSWICRHKTRMFIAVCCFIYLYFWGITKYLFCSYWFFWFYHYIMC